MLRAADVDAVVGIAEVERIAVAEQNPHVAGDQLVQPGQTLDGVLEEKPLLLSLPLAAT